VTEGVLFGLAVFVPLGLVAVVGAFCEWEWLYTSPRATRYISVLGRTGFKILLVIAGLLTILAGLMLALRVFP
jgi:hypothetical protein